MGKRLGNEIGKEHTKNYSIVSVMVRMIDIRYIFSYIANTVLKIYKVTKRSSLAEPHHGGRDWMYK